MNRIQFVITTVLGGVALLLLAACIVLATMNRGLQAEIGARQQFVQQSVQLEALYREIVRALAELGARNNDDAVRAMLQRHGISYTVNAPVAQPQAPATAAPRR
jgi:hypothetical protein